MSFCKWQEEECENYCEGNTDYCATHNHVLRKRRKEAAKPKKEAKPIAKVSKKMAANLKEYVPKKKAHLEKYPDCQVRLKDICKNDRATNAIHHSAKRGKNLTNEETFITACVPCHEFIETRMSALERRERGLLK